MKDELVKLLESVKQLNDYEYVNWDDLTTDNFSFNLELIDRLFDDGFVDNTYVIEQLEFRNDDINWELGKLDPDNSLDNELIENYKAEQVQNNKDIENIKDDNYVLTLDEYEYLEYGYVQAFIMVDYLENVLKQLVVNK